MNIQKKNSHVHTDEDGFDRLAAMVRAYVPTPSSPRPQGGAPRQPSARKPAPPSKWVLFFDTETTIDASQSLRFGAYQLRCSAELVEHGLVYDPEGVTLDELSVLRQVASRSNAMLLTKAEFVDQVFYGRGYDLRAIIVGFNLPFDISRLAIRHNSARGKMKGGFTFQLSSDPRRARVQIRHLNSRSAFTQFAAPPKQRTVRGSRKRNINTAVRRGSFVDLRTIAAALFSRGFSLKSLADHLQTTSRKHEAEAHGAQLTSQYVEYALQDVAVTSECFEVLSRRFDEHGLSKTHIGKIQSEASIGKAYLREMGIEPFFEMQPEFPPEMMGLIMSTYFGGRSEVRWRRSIKQVLYCDFLSMYPTVCTLMRLWKFVVARGMTWSEDTAGTQAFLDDVTLDDLQRPETWQRLHTIVEINPDDDILPLRARYDGTSPTIGLNRVCSDHSLWYTLADAISSKLLTGRPPSILRAITFRPKEPQDDLRPVRIGGPTGPAIDPLVDDLYRRLIDLRSEVKDRIRRACPEEKERLDAEQQALKTLANSTSYGIFVEFNVSELDTYEDRACFGPSGSAFSVRTKKSEEPGPFLNPLIATLITGAARLMLAIAESLAVEAGLDWAFCDTDSMAIAKPDSIGTVDFLTKAKQLVGWFEKLNPYEKPGPLLKIEDANYSDGDPSLSLETLFALCISSKRYVLFNQKDDGSIVIRKASAHGLGHMMAPYSDEAALSDAPTPRADVRDVERWQHDLWHRIIAAMLDGHADEVDLDYHPALKLPAMSRYVATTPAILRWLDSYNRGKPYRDQVKPFGFLVSFQARAFTCPDLRSIGSMDARRKARPPKPIAPYSRSTSIATENTFDRETRAVIKRDVLKPYLLALAQYHLSPELKFRNGDFSDTGRTERRWVRISAINHIGKEANNWEKQVFLGTDKREQIEYGFVPDDQLDVKIKQALTQFSERVLATRLGLSRATLRKALRFGTATLSKQSLARVTQRSQF